jgi:hypothetical protein
MCFQALKEVRGQLYAGGTLPPKKERPIYIEQAARSAPGPVWEH